MSKTVSGSDPITNIGLSTSATNPTKRMGCGRSGDRLLPSRRDRCTSGCETRSRVHPVIFSEGLLLISEERSDWASHDSSSEIRRQRCRFPVAGGNAQGSPHHYARRPKRGRTFSSLHPFGQIESYSCHACRSVPRAALPSCGTRGTAVRHFRRFR
jgi:hypothetical protein